MTKKGNSKASGAPTVLDVHGPDEMDDLLDDLLNQVDEIDLQAKETAPTKAVLTKAEPAHAVETLSKPKGNKKDAREAKRLLKEAEIRRQADIEANSAESREILRLAKHERETLHDLSSSLNHYIHIINSDGHCLYAAFADQMAQTGQTLGYQEARAACAKHIRAHKVDFLPFLELKDSDRAFEEYCDLIERSGEWGGQPELLALAQAFHQQIHVIQADQPQTIIIGDKGDPEIYLSFHKKQYASGEHYNSLRLKASDDHSS